MTRASVPVALREQVLIDARGRCGYCRASEEIMGAPLEIDHLSPESRGGPTERENLWAACRQCNGRKLDRVEGHDPVTGRLAPLFNPRRQHWGDHFAWRDSGALITGLTPTGRATVAALALNNGLIVRARRLWMSVGWHPPVSDVLGDE